MKFEDYRRSYYAPVLVPHKPSLLAGGPKMEPFTADEWAEITKMRTVRNKGGRANLRGLKRVGLAPQLTKWRQDR